MAERPTIDHKAVAPPRLPDGFSLDRSENNGEIASRPPTLPSFHDRAASSVEAANFTAALPANSTADSNFNPVTWTPNNSASNGTGPQPTQPNPLSPFHQLRTDEPNEEDLPLFDGFTVFTAVPSWLASMMVHLILVLFLALLFFPISDKPASLDLVLGDAGQAVDELDDLDELDTMEIELPEQLVDPEPEVEVVETEVVLPVTDLSETFEQIEIVNASLPEMADTVKELNTELKTVARSGQSDQPLNIAGGLGLRNPKSRLQQVLDAGGTRGSEAAVARALKWLASQQRDDGGWDLAAGKPGFIETRGRYGATGLALLPFLGAGHTHKTGEYRYVVKRGIDFLLDEMKVDGLGPEANALLTDQYGTYYAHGLCTIAICEDYAMTRDNKLRIPAQQLINEIVEAQDPSGGGWRYRRREPGDTSVLGWQLMALKSGKMAYLQVPDGTFHRASRFLDSVQTNYGAGYGYTAKNARSSTTAVGLLSRMYLGWDRKHRALAKGVQNLYRVGPDEDEIYFCYYATQVLHHYGGPKWEKWNKEMRDSLVRSQTLGGANEGSWQLRAAHHRSRLYCTSLATMILEVYYRHMPLYGAQAANGTPL